jgi:hypothetical protein
MTRWWAKGPREEVLETWALARARELGGSLEKLPPTLGAKHRPDRVFHHPRRPPAFLELKRAGEEPTPEQAYALAQLRIKGYVAGWANSREMAREFFENAMRPPLVMALAIWQEHVEHIKETRDDRKDTPVAGGRRRRDPLRGGVRRTGAIPTDAGSAGAVDASGIEGA